ncbi:MAG TPA: ABC transporter permease [Pseudolysinimonas sp.]|nr:ABC transporter permease [Pseudolysinimonas sp.]
MSTETVTTPGRAVAQFVSRHWSTWGVPIVLIVLIVLFSITAPAFASLANIATVLQRESVMAIAALGATIVIICGGIDLSMGAVIGLTSIAVTMPIVEAGWSAAATLPVALIAGAAVGVLTGVVVTALRVPPLIATLGVLLLTRGIASIVSDNETLSGADLPAWLTALGRGFLGPIPVSVVIVVVLYLVAHYMMTRTRFGTHTYAIGSNESAARLSGIRVERHKVLVFAIGGLTSALAGILLVARLGSGYALHGSGWEFQIIAAILLGGTSIFGGRGSVLWTLVGVAVLGVLTNGLNLLNVSSFYQTAATGALLIIAVALSEIGRRSRRDDTK